MLDQRSWLTEREMARPPHYRFAYLNPRLSLTDELWLAIIDDNLRMADIITLSRVNRKFRRICDWKHPAHRAALIEFADRRRDHLRRFFSLDHRAAERAVQFLWQEC